MYLSVPDLDCLVFPNSRYSNHACRLRAAFLGGINVSKIIRVVLASLLALVLSFGAGYFAGRFGDTGKSASYIVDTSGVDRITGLARSGLIEERRELESRTASVTERERRLAEARSLDQRERERIVTDRESVAEIEKRCRDTIRIIEARARDGEVEK